LETIRRRVELSGRVQGVAFRASTHARAQREGLTGFVRNRHDGSVEAVFEGPREGVERLVAWCREGPPHARVDAARVHEEPLEGLARFEIR
jgi:acylphosphatase